MSRQSAQRLVSLAVSEGLIKVRLDHPIGRCMSLAETMEQQYGLQFAMSFPAIRWHPFPQPACRKLGPEKWSAA